MSHDSRMYEEGRHDAERVNLVLTIRVLASMDVQQFTIPLDLTGPATLTIKPGEFGIGHRISILDADLGLRCWYAHELIGLQFEPGE